MNQRNRQLRKITLKLLDSNSPIHSLQPEVIELIAILVNSNTVQLNLHHDISKGETRTANGLALSPKMAAMCADDFMRTIAFIRGTYSAIIDNRKRYPDRPARVLYAGCGPYATLAVPLMEILLPSEAVFTLLDLHSESIVSAKSIVNSLSLSKSVEKFETIDASLYQVCSDNPPDIILIEILQACLDSEPQVAISRHLLSQVSSAILIPEEIHVDLMMVDASTEFNLDQVQNSENIQRDRIPIGSVFSIKKEAIYSWKDNSSSRLPGTILRIPDSVEEQYQPMLFTKIRIYKNHILKYYDCGLTYPKLLSAEHEIKSGNTVKFHYDLGRYPRLSCQVCV